MEKKIEDVLTDILQKIGDVVMVEGDTEKIVLYGNSLIIKFKNGNTYRQEFISKVNLPKATLDKL